MSATLTVVLAICIAVFTSVTAPIFLARYLEHQRHEDRMEDYARQDKVAAQVEAAAVQAAQAADLLKANNELVAATAETTQAQLKEIHTAVNSTLTAAITETLESNKRELALMREVYTDPDVQQEAHMRQLSESIAEKQATITDRKTQQE